MTATSIIAKKVSTEDMPIPREVLVDYALRQVSDGEVLIFHYHPVVFTVNVRAEYPVVHLYADDSGHGLLRASRLFMQDVWGKVPHKYLIAPILSSGVKALVKRFGWVSTGEWYPTGHETFTIERPKS
jgi:hypothetical protein